MSEKVPGRRKRPGDSPAEPYESPADFPTDSPPDSPIYEEQVEAYDLDQPTVETGKDQVTWAKPDYDQQDRTENALEEDWFWREPSTFWLDDMWEWPDPERNSGRRSAPRGPKTDSEPEPS